MAAGAGRGGLPGAVGHTLAGAGEGRQTGAAGEVGIRRAGDEVRPPWGRGELAGEGLGGVGRACCIAAWEAVLGSRGGGRCDGQEEREEVAEAEMQQC